MDAIELNDVAPIVDAWIRARGTSMEGNAYAAALDLAAHVKAALAHSDAAQAPIELRGAINEVADFLEASANFSVISQFTAISEWIDSKTAARDFDTWASTQAWADKYDMDVAKIGWNAALAAPVAPRASRVPIEYGDVARICAAHEIGLPIDCVDMVVEIIRHVVPVAPGAAAQPDHVADERKLAHPHESVLALKDRTIAFLRDQNRRIIEAAESIRSAAAAKAGVTLLPMPDPSELLEIARATGLRSFLHGVNAANAREILETYQVAVDGRRAMLPLGAAK